MLSVHGIVPWLGCLVSPVCGHTSLVEISREGLKALGSLLLVSPRWSFWGTPQDWGLCSQDMRTVSITRGLRLLSEWLDYQGGGQQPSVRVPPSSSSMLSSQCGELGVGGGGEESVSRCWLCCPSTPRPQVPPGSITFLPFPRISLLNFSLDSLAEFLKHRLSIRTLPFFHYWIILSMMFSTKQKFPFYKDLWS